ncbi:MAG TPA: 4Fe-4S binding protein [Anaerolineaceae bacterium]|nr:4Fe-4S binding protein [Anaerolineaceae bacterium]
MKIGSMFGNVIQSLFKKPVTEMYPFVKKSSPERYRGQLFFDPSRCTACQLCVKDCPAEALELIVIDRAAKKIVMHYQADRCTFCGQCVVDCKFDCLNMDSQRWELAATRKEPFTFFYGNEADVQSILASAAQGGAQPPAQG